MEGVLLESRRKAVLRQRTLGQHVRAMLAVANAKSLPPTATVEGGTKGILDQKLASTAASLELSKGKRRRYVKNRFAQGRQAPPVWCDSG